MTEREQRTADATRLLIHYFRTVFNAAGLPWDSDNEAEMHGLAVLLVGT
jgi:hypothetical protein